MIILAAVYISERFELQGNFFEPQNPRFIIESGFKSNAGWDGTRMIHKVEKFLTSLPRFDLVTLTYQWKFKSWAGELLKIWGSIPLSGRTKKFWPSGEGIFSNFPAHDLNFHGRWGRRGQIKIKEIKEISLYS